jgi:hypothetical protein
VVLLFETQTLFSDSLVCCSLLLYKASLIWEFLPFLISFKGTIMAFVTTSAPAQQTREQAAKWVNIYLPTEDGGKLKVGAFPLNKSNTTQAAVVDLLNTEEGAQAFIDNLIVVIQDGAPEKSAIKFKLG